MSKEKSNDIEMVEIEILKGEYSGGLCICINGLRICGCADKHYKVVQMWRIKKSRLLEDLDIDDWIQEKWVGKEKVREAVRTIGIMEVRKKLNAILEEKDE